MNVPHTITNTAELITQYQPNAPIYLFCSDTLEQQVNRFKSGFDGALGYAVKSNPDPRVIRALGAMGVRNFDVASLAEVKAVARAVPEARLLYDNPIKSAEEIKIAYHEYSTRVFAIDDLIELKKIDAIAKGDSGVNIVVRFKIDDAEAVYDLSTKFGCSANDAAALLKEANALGYKTSLTFHVGSQCTKATSYTNYITQAAAIAKSAAVPLAMVNVGGGFPSPYLEADLPKLSAYFAEIRTAWNEHFEGVETELVCEPGRALVDTSVTLLTRVKHRRQGDVVYINDGVYGAFMEQVFSPIEHPVRHFRADGSEVAVDITRPFTVFGPTCDSIDKLYYQPKLNIDIREGDYLEWGLMGGYGSATATQFNGFESNQYVTVEEAFDYPRSVMSNLGTA